MNWKKARLKSTTSPQICCCTTLWKLNVQLYSYERIYGQKRQLFCVFDLLPNVSLTMHFICCLGCRSRDGVPPATIYFSRRAENCDHQRVAETITALHQPRDQSMASPAGMRSPTTRSTYRTLLLNIVVTMFDVDDLLIYHPNIILTSDVYDIVDNMH